MAYFIKESQEFVCLMALFLYKTQGEYPYEEQNAQDIFLSNSLCELVINSRLANTAHTLSSWALEGSKTEQTTSQALKDMIS